MEVVNTNLILFNLQKIANTYSGKNRNIAFEIYDYVYEIIENNKFNIEVKSENEGKN